MSINTFEVKKFWLQRSKEQLPMDSLSCLENNPFLVKIKLFLESQKIRKYIQDLKGIHCLDLGSGTGYWSRVLSQYFQHIDSVEYIKNFINLSQNEDKKQKINNIKYYNQSVNNFRSVKKYDMIFISGLFIYLTDYQIVNLFIQIIKYSKKGTYIILRDGTSILPHQYEFNSKYSHLLNSKYSAIYRTRQEYLHIFEQYGFKLIKDEDMFTNNILLNKFREKKLRIYLFQRTK